MSDFKLFALAILMIFTGPACTKSAKDECVASMSKQYSFRDTLISNDSGQKKITGVLKNKTGDLSKAEFPVRVYYFDASGNFLGSETQNLHLAEYEGSGTKILKVSEEAEFRLPFNASYASAASVRILHDNGLLCGGVISPY